MSWLESITGSLMGKQAAADPPIDLFKLAQEAIEKARAVTARAFADLESARQKVPAYYASSVQSYEREAELHHALEQNQKALNSCYKEGQVKDRSGQVPQFIWQRDAIYRALEKGPYCSERIVTNTAEGEVYLAAFKQWRKVHAEEQIAVKRLQKLQRIRQELLGDTA